MKEYFYAILKLISIIYGKIKQEEDTIVKYFFSC